MVSNQDVCNASLESSTSSRNIGGTCSCDKNHFGAFCSDFFFETRNGKTTCDIVWRRVHHFINAASVCIKKPVVNIYSWMECLDRIELLPTDESSYNYFIICVWGPKSHHEYICPFTEFEWLLR